MAHRSGAFLVPSQPCEHGPFHAPSNLLPFLSEKARLFAIEDGGLSSLRKLLKTPRRLSSERCPMSSALLCCSIVVEDRNPADDHVSPRVATSAPTGTIREARRMAIVSSGPANASSETWIRSGRRQGPAGGVPIGDRVGNRADGRADDVQTSFRFHIRIGAVDTSCQSRTPSANPERPALLAPRRNSDLAAQERSAAVEPGSCGTEVSRCVVTSALSAWSASTQARSRVHGTQETGPLRLRLPVPATIRSLCKNVLLNGAADQSCDLQGISRLATELKRAHWLQMTLRHRARG